MFDFSVHDNAIYSILGVPATMVVNGHEVPLTVIDEVRSKSTATSADSGSVETRSVEAACWARVPELIQNGIARTDYRGSIITFNGRSWIVRNHDPRGGPNGEDLGEVKLLLRSVEATDG